MSRKHYCTRITKYGFYKPCPFVTTRNRENQNSEKESFLCCGYHNVAIWDDPELDRDEYGLKGGENCVYSSWKNKLKGVWQLLFFQ